MTTLNVQAVITAVDRLTGPLRAMGAAVGGMQNRFVSAGAAASQFGMGAGMAAAGLIAATTSGQYELDKALRAFQVVGTATNKQREDMRALADDVAVKLGMPQLELIQGATELLSAGLSVGDLQGKDAAGITMFQNIAEGAKVAGESIENMAKDLVTLAKSFNLDWKTPEERLKTLDRLMGMAIVAPRLSPDTPTSHVSGLKEFGAIGAQLGLTPEQASAIQNTLSSAGFPGEKGGMAMKTILQRMLNPTPGAQAAMSALGFNYGRVFKNDLSKLSGRQFVDALGTAGINGADARGFIERHLGKGVAAGGELDLLRWQTELADGVSKALGLKKGDAQNRKIVKKAMDGLVGTTNHGMDVIAFLEELGQMPVASLKDLAGLHHASKAAVLQFQESLRTYKSNLERLKAESPGAIDEGLAVKLEGFAFQVDKLSASWTAFKNALSTTGVFGGALESISGALNSLTGMDPAKMEALSKAVTGLGLGLAGLAAGSAGVWVLARLGALMTGPLGKLIAAGGLAALLGPGMFDPQQFNVAGGMQDGLSPFMSVLTQASGLMTSIAGLADDAAVAFAKLGGIDLGNSALITSLNNLAAAIGVVRDGVEALRKWTPMDDLAAGKNPNPWWRPVDPGKFFPKGQDPRGGVPGFWEDFKSFFGGGAAQVPNPGGGRFGPGFNSGPGMGEQLGGGGQQAIVERLNSPLQVIMAEPQVAKLEGSGTVSVTVTVKGPGELSGVSAADDGKNIKLNTGGGMPDTNR